MSNGLRSLEIAESWKANGDEPLWKDITHVDEIWAKLSLGNDPNHALAAAARIGDFDTLEYILAHYRNITSMGINKATIEAAGGGWLNIVRYFVNNGVNGEALAHALIEASANGHLSIVRYLVNKGAENEGDDTISHAISEAAFQGHLSVVMYLLGRHSDYLDMVIINAASGGQMALLQFLFSQGLHLEEYIFDNAIEYATTNEFYDVADYMREQKQKTFNY